MDILRIVEATIKEHSLIERGDRVLVALSGGADSALLMRLLCKLRDRLGFTVGACHVNHQLRATADRDEEFSRALSKELGAEFHSKKVDIRALCQKAKMSEEEYARYVRYDFFESLGYDKIATAHNKNDVAETLLFNFMRGASSKGLSGIPYKRGKIIRPLLDVKKADVLSFCDEMGYSYVTDETNLEALYSRNKIRLKLIPEIEKEFNANFVDVVVQNARIIAQDCEYLDKLALEFYQKGELTGSELSTLSAPILSRVCQLYYKEASGESDNLASGYIDEIVSLISKNQTGTRIDLPNGMTAFMEYGQLKICKKQKKISFCYEMEAGSVLKIPEIGKNILIEETSGKADIHLADTDGLCIRSKRAGDVFYPVGMDGRKKLSDFFTDKKIPAGKREKIPLLTKDGEIVSVIGYRNDRRFTDGKAYRIIITEE